MIYNKVESNSINLKKNRIMPVKYNVVERKNPNDPTAPAKFYASAKADRRC